MLKKDSNRSDRDSWNSSTEHYRWYYKDFMKKLTKHNYHKINSWTNTRLSDSNFMDSKVQAKKQ